MFDQIAISFFNMNSDCILTTFSLDKVFENNHIVQLHSFLCFYSFHSPRKE